MTWLLLCEPSDHGALWARDGLEELGLTPFQVITTAMLGPSQRWEHRVSDAGTFLSIEMSTGQFLRSDCVRGVLNRCVRVPHWSCLDAATAEDRHYADAEISAFFLGWLASLPRPILNEPTPFGLAGRWRDHGEWTLLASRAGLATEPYANDGSNDPFPPGGMRRSVSQAARQVIVVDSEVIGDELPTKVHDACAQLARLSMTRLLGIRLVDASTPWTFAGASVLPNLRVGGAALLRALARSLRGRTS